MEDKNLNLFSDGFLEGVRKGSPSLYMTLKEVAEALSVSTDLVQKRVRELFPDKMKPRRTTFLNELEATQVKLRIQENSSIISTGDDRHQLPKTEIEKEFIIQQALIFQQEKIQILEARIEILAPKAELADAALRDKEEHYSITEAGKHLGLRQSEIFKILKDNGLLTLKSLPSQKALSYQVLILRSNANLGERNRPQSIMTMENMDNFRKRYMK